MIYDGRDERDHEDRNSRGANTSRKVLGGPPSCNRWTCHGLSGLGGHCHHSVRRDGEAIGCSITGPTAPRQAAVRRDPDDLAVGSLELVASQPDRQHPVAILPSRPASKTARVGIEVSSARASMRATSKSAAASPTASMHDGFSRRFAIFRAFGLTRPEPRSHPTRTRSGRGADDRPGIPSTARRPARPAGSSRRGPRGLPYPRAPLGLPSSTAHACVMALQTSQVARDSSERSRRAA